MAKKKKTLLQKAQECGLGEMLMAQRDKDDELMLDQGFTKIDGPAFVINGQLYDVWIRTCLPEPDPSATTIL